MEHKKDQIDVVDVAPKSPIGKPSQTLARMKTKAEEETDDKEDRIDDGKAIANDRLNSANDE